MIGVLCCWFGAFWRSIGTLWQVIGGLWRVIGRSVPMSLTALPIDRGSLREGLWLLPLFWWVGFRVGWGCSVNCGRGIGLVRVTRKAKRAPAGGMGLFGKVWQRYKLVKQTCGYLSTQEKMVKTILEYPHGIIAHDLNRGL